MKEALYISGDVVHALQRERGCAAIYLYSEGKLFSQRAEARFAETDRSMKALREGLERWRMEKALKAPQIRKLETLLEAFEEVAEQRASIMAQTISASQSINYYTHQVIGPLLQAMVEIALYMEGNDPTRVSAYHAFMQWKERIGLERTIGARGFIGYSFHNKEFMERLFFLLSEQENYRQTFWSLADDSQKHLVEAALEESENDRLEKLHEAMMNSPEASILYDLTPESWFDLITTKIDVLHTAERQLADTLAHQPKSPAPVEETQKLNTQFGEYDAFVRSLQLFSGLSDEQVRELLRHGQIRTFAKGKLLFLEGEQANRLYIILKGWVKLFKGTASGEEAILQMLSSGDSILESAVFLNTSFPVSAQIAEDAILLSLPAPVIREQIRSNNDLALNLLASMSHRSQGLIRQIEGTRLKSVDERIGWFLLKLLLEQGRISRCIELPYDKSLIASYLDMKRETFSRALKRLKMQGIRIENDTIVIPDLAALCGFCDPDLALQCALHGTPDCPNPQC